MRSIGVLPENAQLVGRVGRKRSAGQLKKPSLPAPVIQCFRPETRFNDVQLSEIWFVRACLIERVIIIDRIEKTWNNHWCDTP